MPIRHLIGNVLRNLAQRVDPQPPRLTWTYHAGTGKVTIDHWHDTA